jgi:solute carrier family 25 (adenine nucleotide translocator) protein 4/5/6/31
MQTNHYEISFLESFFISGFAAIISKTIAAPIERLKLLLQNQGEMIKQGKLDKTYKNAFDCMIRTYRNEGFLSFWRGNLANCIRYFPTQALNFAFKDKIKILLQIDKKDSQKIKLLKNILAGGIAGFISLPFVYSLDYARTRLSNDILLSGNNGARQFKGLIDVYLKTIKTDGIVGLHRGFSISAFAMFFYRGAYFGIYDTMQPLMNKGKSNNFLKNFLLGYSITVFAGLAMYPLDSVRRRMMMRSGEVEKYKGSIDCFRNIVKTEGFGALMKGAGVNIFRGIAGAGVLSFFDKFMEIYTGIKIKTSSTA